MCGDKFEELFKKVLGANYSDVGIQIGGDKTLRGLITRKTIDKGSVILSIPKKWIMFPWSKVYNKGGGLASRTSWAKQWLTMSIFEAKVVSSWKIKFDWKEYVDSLPEDIELPVLSLKTDPAFDISIFPKDAQKKLEEQLNQLNTDFEQISLLDPRVPKCKNVFFWSWACVHTRSVTVPNPWINDSSTIAMIPIFDMLNHSPYSSDTVLKMENSCLKLYASDSYKPGDQIFIKYGEHDNLSLLLDYGFCMMDEDEPLSCDAVCLDYYLIDMLPEDARDVIKNDLMPHGYWMDYTIGYAEISWRLLNCVRYISCMSADERKAWLQLIKGEIEIINRENEIRSFKLLSRLFQKAIEDYRTKIQKINLSKEQLPFGQQVKSILTKYVLILKRQLEEIEDGPHQG